MRADILLGLNIGVSGHQPSVYRGTSLTAKSPTIAPNLAAKLRGFVDGQVVRCSRADFERLDALVPGVLALRKREDVAWNGYVLSGADDRASELVKAFLQEHRIDPERVRAVSGKSTLARQLAYIERSVSLGRKKLAMYIEPQAASDLDYLAAQLGGKKVAVEKSLAEMAARMRRKEAR